MSCNHHSWIGALARLELKCRCDAGVNAAEISSEHYRSLALRVGETLLRPRRTKVFLNPT